MNYNQVKLKDVAKYANEKMKVNELKLDNYISTENMLQDKNGIRTATSLPLSEKVNKFRKDDILISNIRPYFRKIWYAQFDGGNSADVLVIRSNQKLILPEYLYYILFQDKFFDYVMVGAKGVKMPRGDKQFIMNYTFNLPDLKSQKIILEKLSPITRKIESNIKLIHLLESYTQLLFHKWFVDFNFPDRVGKAYSDNNGAMYEVEGSYIPSGWRKEKLSDSAEFINGLAMQKFPPKNEADKLPVIKIREINNNGFGNEVDYMTKNIESKYIIKDGDILFPWSASLGVYIWTNGLGGLNQHIFKVVSKGYPEWFIYYWIQVHMPYFKRIASGKKTTMGHINRRHLDMVYNLIPTEEIMEKMDNKISPLYSRIISLHSENQILKNIRDLLIHKLV